MSCYPVCACHHCGGCQPAPNQLPQEEADSRTQIYSAYRDQFLNPEPCNLSDIRPAFGKDYEAPESFYTHLFAMKVHLIEDYIKFRMQTHMTGRIEPKDVFTITTLHPRVWEMFKTHLLSHAYSKVTERKYSVRNHGYYSRIPYVTQSIEFSKNSSNVITLPPLATPNWYMDESGELKIAEVYSIRFTYNQFNSRLRADFLYHTKQLNSFKDSRTPNKHRWETA